MLDSTVIEAKSFGVFTCNPRTTLQMAAKRMAEEDVSALVVVDHDGCLAGIITRTDLLRAVQEGDDWPSRPVEEFMNRDVVTVSVHTLLRDIVPILLQKQIHRVVAVRKDGDQIQPLAVVSAADLITNMVKDAG